MSTTTPTGQNHLADVASYAAAVRRELVGLSPEQVEDLTDGLEADLADALADPLTSWPGTAPGADLTVRFGSPAAYAQELRAAAGLPDAAVPQDHRRMRALLTAPARTVTSAARGVLARLREHTGWAPVEEFLVALTPAAWLLRGWVVAGVVAAVFGVGARSAWMPDSLAGWLFLGLLCVVSVQWGRGRWAVGRWSRRARVAMTTVAVVAALPVLAMNVAHDGQGTQYIYLNDGQTGSAPAAPQDGVVVDGMAVSNLFAYDAAGNPIDGVQIFDDRGRPVRTTSDHGTGEWSLPGVADRWSFVSAQDADGRRLWNVYPLLGGPSASFEWNDNLGQRVLAGGVAPRTPPRPFAKAPAVTLPAGTATGPTAGATTGPAAVAPDSASPAPTSTP
jgi:hypothetical protein